MREMWLVVVRQSEAFTYASAAVAGAVGILICSLTATTLAAAAL